MPELIRYLQRRVFKLKSWYGLSQLVRGALLHFFSSSYYPIAYFAIVYFKKIKLKLTKPKKKLSGSDFDLILLLVPKYIVASDLFELTEELIQINYEYTFHRPKKTKIIFYDVQDTTSTTADLRRLSLTHTIKFIYLFGPNPDFRLRYNQLKQLSVNPKNKGILIATDYNRRDHRHYCLRILSHFDIIIGLDEKPSANLECFGLKTLGPVPIFSGRTVKKYQLAQFKIFERDIEVAIFGTLYNDRRVSLEYLKQAGVLIQHIGGTYGLSRLSYQDYLKASQRAKIRIVHTLDSGQKFHTSKGHVFETLLTGALLLIDCSTILPTYLELGRDYDYFQDHKELLHKIKFYLENDESRENIAASGHKKILLHLNLLDELDKIEQK